MRWRAVLVGSLLVAAGGLIAMVPYSLSEASPAKAAGKFEPLVKPGNEAKAKEYYEDLSKKLPHLKAGSAIEGTDITDMLDYFGFPKLLPKDLEKLDPAVLMSFQDLQEKVSNSAEVKAAYKDKPIQGGEILATRFFAPKIVNVAVPKAQRGSGWRKLIRFKAREGSDAKKKDGLDSFYLLFNFGSQGSTYPSTQADQIQAMVVQPYADGVQREAYFLVYNNLKGQDPGKANYFLNASFDVGVGQPADHKYYVPTACAQCHGASDSEPKKTKVNLLDTDHWLDRASTQDNDESSDFNVLRKDVLVDGPAGFSTLRDLNREIAKQNEAVDKNSFQRLAAEKWLAVHANNDGHVDLFARALKRTDNSKVWSEQNETDRKLLPLLNRYCFRCHSSLEYHVFEKQAVFARRSDIADRLQSKNPKFLMPQDRKLGQETVDTILDLLKQLK